MIGDQLERAFEAGALREIERSLHAKLRAHRLSEAFISRCGDDALQKGLLEYLRVREAGTEIRDPGGFVVQAAFRRAVDELRREAREAGGTDVERLLELGAPATPAAEELALERLSAAELHQAIDSLPAEERQVLSLHYFEELSDERAAKLVYCSERTFRRRLRTALTHLAQAIGSPAPEPGTHRALEVGLACWTSLRGARVVLAANPLEPLARAFESAQQWMGRLLDRARHPSGRLAASEVPEQIGALASGPAGKVIGGCAGAAIVCIVSGVAVSNIDLGGSPRHAAGPTQAHHIAESADKRPPATRPLLTTPVEGSAKEASGPATPPEGKPPGEQPADRQTVKRPPSASKRRRAEERQLEEQMSGIVRASEEAESESAPATSEAATPETAPVETHSTSEPPSSSAASEERQVEKQFRGPLAR